MPPEAEMETLLITGSVLLGLALLQAIIGILFFSPRAAVISFFFQTLCLVASITLTIILLSWQSLLAGWFFMVLFAILFICGFRSWKKKSVST